MSRPATPVGDGSGAYLTADEFAAKVRHHQAEVASFQNVMNATPLPDRVGLVVVAEFRLVEKVGTADQARRETKTMGGVVSRTLANGAIKVFWPGHGELDYPANDALIEHASVIGGLIPLATTSTDALQARNRELDMEVAMLKAAGRDLEMRFVAQVDETKQAKIRIGDLTRRMTNLETENQDLRKRLADLQNQAGQPSITAAARPVGNLNAAEIEKLQIDSLAYEAILSRTKASFTGEEPRVTDISTWKLPVERLAYAGFKRGLLMEHKEFFEGRALRDGEKDAKQQTADKKERERFYRILRHYCDVRNRVLLPDEEAVKTIQHFDVLLMMNLEMLVRSNARRQEIATELEREDYNPLVKEMLQNASNEFLFRKLAKGAVDGPKRGSGGGASTSPR